MMSEVRIHNRRRQTAINGLIRYIEREESSLCSTYQRLRWAKTKDGS